LPEGTLGQGVKKTAEPPGGTKDSSQKKKGEGGGANVYKKNNCICNRGGVGFDDRDRDRLGSGKVAKQKEPKRVIKSGEDASWNAKTYSNGQRGGQGLLPGEGGDN